MVSLHAVVYTNRNYVGTLTVHVHDKDYEFPICAKSDDELEVNDPPVGRIYQLVRIVKTDDDEEVRAAYGPAVIFFETASKDFVLALHGGNTDITDQLLPTEGTLRMINGDLVDLLSLIREERKVILTLSEEDIGIYRRFVTAKVSSYRSPRISHNDSTGYRGTSFIDDMLNSPFFWMWLFSRSEEDTVSHGETIVELTGSIAEQALPHEQILPAPVHEMSQDATTPDEPVTNESQDLPLIVDPYAKQETEVSYESEHTQSNDQEEAQQPPVQTVPVEAIEYTPLTDDEPTSVSTRGGTAY